MPVVNRTFDENAAVCELLMEPRGLIAR